MPKDEFDFDDPFELNGMALLSHEDTTDAMVECFAEEFMRMGYNHKQILALFKSRQYLGPNMAFEKRGEPFIRELIAEVFARRGKAVTWSVAAGVPPAVEAGVPPGGSGTESTETLESPDVAGGSGVIPGGRMPPSTAGETPAATFDHDETLTDPMGAPIPKLNA